MTTKKITRKLSEGELKVTSGGKTAEDIPGMKGFARRIPKRNRKIQGHKV